GNWYGGSLFHNLTTPIAAGRATLWFTNGGDTANVEIFNPATLTSETFTGSGILSNPPTGTAVGIGYFGDGTADDFQAYTGVPTTSALTLTAPRVGSDVYVMVTHSTPFNLVAVLSSSTGNGPTPTTVGPLFLSAPIAISATLNTDLSGRAQAFVGVPPPFLVGAPAHLQAFDVGTQTLSNHFSIVVF
ncbi:MAG: hypothetical protein KDB53_06220, partial [Planctomycetes bacterium]|nr:hypothetical protein [Planctomycetota bacterium]